MKTPELVAPAGNLSKLKTALHYGADAVYVGTAGLSMRPDEACFSISELDEAIQLTHRNHKRLYVCVNSLMFQQDIEMLSRWLSETDHLAFDALILSDLGAFRLVKERRPALPIHISTQLSTANAAAAEFLREAGASRIVLARECSLQNTREISENSKIELEVFIHGAMCMAISGRCLLSAHLSSHSASQGRCKHSCRWEWQLVEQKRPGQTMDIFESGKKTFLMGSTDLCLLELLPEVVATGVNALKIEGRMKSEYYVAAITRVYREALDRYATDPLNYTMDSSWLDELNAVSHRPYSIGFALGYPEHDPRKLQAPNRPESSCEIVAFIQEVKNESYRLLVKNPFSEGETLQWIGPKMKNGIVKIKSIENAEGDKVQTARSAETVKVEFEPQAESLDSFSILRRPKNQVVAE